MLEPGEGDGMTFQEDVEMFCRARSVACVLEDTAVSQRGDICRRL